MTRVAGTILFMKFTVAVTHEAPWYIARCLDVDVVSQGETVDEALANLEAALGLYFEGEYLPDSLEPLIITTVFDSCVSPALPVVSGQRADTALEKIGFVQVDQRASHVKLRDHGGRTVIVPTHRELARGTLSTILR